MKKEKIDKYWSSQQLKSYNRIMSMVVSERGIGKTYEMKKSCIKDFIKKGSQFMWVRRYKEELKSIGKFFDDLNNNKEFNGYTFKVVKKNGIYFTCNDKVMGFAVAMTQANTIKSTSYPLVKTIILDEALLPKGHYRYLDNEVEVLLNIGDTIFRDRDEPDLRIILLANNVSFENPYTLYFNVIVNPNSKTTVTDDFYFEYPDAEIYREERKKTRYARLIDNTNYGDMSLYNRVVQNNHFIEKRSGTSKHLITLIFNESHIGVWRDLTLGKLYCSYKVDESSKNKYVMQVNDFEPNLMFMRSWKDDFYLRTVVNAYYNGYLFYENQSVKNEMMKIFRKMSLRGLN